MSKVKNTDTVNNKKNQQTIKSDHTTATDQYDVVVIGAGSAGVRFARVAASLGATVVLVESQYMGGTCVNVGCIPKKLFVYGSKVSKDITAAEGYGWDIQSSPFTWDRLRDNKTKEIERLNNVYRNLIAQSQVRLIEGHAEILSPHSVRIGAEIILTKRIVIATGGWPSLPDIPGKDNFITSNEIFSLNTLPKSAIILGGGYIAVEFAGILNGLGVETTLIYRGDLFLRGFDADIREALVEQMKAQGIRLMFNTNINEIKKYKRDEIKKYKKDEIESSDEYFCSSLTNGEVVKSEAVIACTGRNPKTDNLGLEAVGVKCDERGYIEVDTHYRTNINSIFALGDVVGRMPLTPVAIREGMILAHNLFGQDGSGENNRRTPEEWHQVDYGNIPTAVFSQPEIATIGYLEKEAKARFGEVDVYLSKFRPLKHTLTGLPVQNVMKMVVVRDSQKVVGLHLLGSDSAEIIQGFAVAMKLGATKADFDATLGVHPTSAEELVTLR